MNETNNLRIIIVDDNPAIHKDFMKILISSKASPKNEGFSDIEKKLFGEEENAINNKIDLPIFEIDTASQGQEGVEKIAKALQENNPYALAFVDIRMPPGWDGIETIKHIWELDQNIQVVICTAYSDYTWEETVAALGQRDNLLILKKPYDHIAVRQIACALTKKWQLSQETKEYTHSLEDRVTERTQSLNKSLALMRATLESSGEGVLVITKEGVISDFNNKFLEILSLTAEQLKQYDFNKLVDLIISLTEEPSEFLKQLNQLTQKKNDVLIGKIKFKNNKIFEYYTQPYMLEKTSIGRVWSFRDISKSAFLEEELQYQATHDALTGLPNRVLLYDRLQQSITHATHNHTRIGVLFFDLDRFKLINDSISHEAGDEVLRAVAKRVQSEVKSGDTLVRLGGDEFVIILNDIEDEAYLSKFANKLLDVFKERFQILDHNLLVSSSIGIATYPKDGKKIDILLRNADTAMYQAKALGADQFHFYVEELNKKNMVRLEKETALRQALKNNEFFLVYQPQFDLKTGKLVSVEALIRWQHPTEGVILPIDFIPIAEETGLIVSIGEWVLRAACLQNKKWQEAGLAPIRIAVNITTKQLRLYNFVEIIRKILQETGLDPKFLELELTENIIISNIDIKNTIIELKKIGLQIALDDFGSGFSSINYLREIPVDRLKIDQSYVQNFDSNRGDDVIIQAIIAMANNLHLEVLAEGVESEKQIEFLKSSKCDEVQGYYCSKPISPDACEKLLRNINNPAFIKNTKKEKT